MFLCTLSFINLILNSIFCLFYDRCHHCLKNIKKLKYSCCLIMLQHHCCIIGYCVGETDLNKPTSLTIIKMIQYIQLHITLDNDNHMFCYWLLFTILYVFIVILNFNFIYLFVCLSEEQTLPFLYSMQLSCHKTILPTLCFSFKEKKIHSKTIVFKIVN